MSWTEVWPCSCINYGVVVWWARQFYLDLRDPDVYFPLCFSNMKFWLTGSYICWCRWIFRCGIVLGIRTAQFHFQVLITCADLHLSCKKVYFNGASASVINLALAGSPRTDWLNRTRTVEDKQCICNKQAFRRCRALWSKWRTGDFPR